MRQVCPYCSQAVEIADSLAGGETPCPACGKPFAVPKGYTPSVNVAPEPKPAPPPGLVPPAPPMPQIPTLHDECGVTLSPRLIAWIPALCVTGAVISSFFFSWVGAFPGGFRAFSQSPVQALFASFNVQTFVSLQDTEKALESTVKTNWLMLPFLLLLILLFLFTWFERFFPNPRLGRVPAALSFLVGFWPKRHFVLIGLNLCALGFLHLQSWKGFSLETSLKEISTKKFEKDMEDADTTHKKQEVQVRMGMEIGRYCIDETLAARLGFGLLWLSLITLILDCWLDRRVNKPAPRIVLKS